MQVKLFTIPILGGEQIQEELNAFLRSRKVLQVEQQLVANEQGNFWCFCIKYLANGSSSNATNSKYKKKVDYKEVLDAASFQRFSKMREIRRKVAQEDAVPAFAVFTDAELAELAKIEGELTISKLKSVRGIGEKKAAKYGQHFIKSEKSESSH